MIIQANDTYRYYLERYQQFYHTEPTFIERTTAFFCSRDNTLPYWFFGR